MPTNFTLRQSCSPIGAVTCSAVTKLVVFQSPAPPPPLPPAPRSPASPLTPESPPLLATSACAPFALSQGQKYADCVITVPAGQSLYAGGCGISGGASCYGDTRFLLMSSIGLTLTSNDNGTVLGCGACSLVNYTNTGYFPVKLVLRQQCVPPRTGVCGGTSSYALVAPGSVIPYTRRSLMGLGGGDTPSVTSAATQTISTNSKSPFRRTLIVAIVAIALSL
jgi:hypothetical protein